MNDREDRAAQRAQDRERRAQERVAAAVARTEARAADIDGISSVQDRFTGDGHVTGRAEQFQVIL